MSKTSSFLPLLSILSLFSIVSCTGILECQGPRGTMQQTMEQRDESSKGIRIFNAPYNKVFKAVEKAITRKEYKIRVYDETRGIIDSDYRLHDGYFTLGFIGSKLRSRILVRFAKIDPKKVEVTLKILAEKEKENESGTWEDFPVSYSNLDLIDSDSYDMYFYYISENIKSTDISEVDKQDG